jgi:hypothetical protein
VYYLKPSTAAVTQLCTISNRLQPLLRSCVLSQTAYSHCYALMSLSVRLGLTAYVALRTLESYTSLKGQYGLRILQRGWFRLLLVAFLVLRMLGFLGSKLVTLGIRYCLPLFTLFTYLFGGDLNYAIQYLSGLRSHPITISLVVSNSLPSDTKGCYDEEAVQALSHGSPGVVSRVCYRA